MAERFAFGALPPKKDIREYRVTCATAIDETQFPEEFELTIPLTVKNQGSVGSCHDDQTEVLTKKGWKLFKDITYEDELASVNPEDGVLIFEKPTNILTYDYSGEMIVGNHQSLDFKVTPNHKMVVRTFNSQTKHLNDNYEFIDASDLGWWNGLRTDFHHITNEDAGSIVFEEEKLANGNILPRLEIDMHLWVQFLGIYLAEGNFDKDGEKYHYRIQLAAVKDRERNYIKQLLSQMGLSVSDCYKDRFFIYNKRIRNKLEEYGFMGVKSYEKFVPDFIFDLDEIYIKEFLYGFAMGDGCIRKNGVVNYYTSTKKLAEQLEILILMSGSNAKIIKNKWKEAHLLDGRTIKTKHQSYTICTKIKPLSINKKHDISVEDYNGKVYCAEVPTYHTLITKRNGNTLLSGNCVAHGISSAIEYYNKLQEETDVVFSTGYIYGNRRNTSYKKPGMYIDEALSNAVKYGDVPNSLFNINVEVPDAISQFEEKAFELSPNAIPNRISEYFALRSDAERKLNLMQNGPIVFSIEWFKGAYVDKKNHDILTHAKEAPGGSYHCMIIYGWNKWGWKFQNSWGKYWGNNGRGVLPYDYPFSTCYGIKDEISEKQRNKKVSQLEVTIQELNANLAIKDKEFHELSAKLVSYQTELEARNAKIATVRQLVDETKNKLETTQQAKNLLYIEIENLEASLASLREDSAATEDAINKLNARIADLKNQEEQYIAEGNNSALIEVQADIELFTQNLNDYNNKVIEINDNMNYVSEQIFIKRNAVSEIELEVTKLQAALENCQLDYEDAFKKLGDLSASNVELNTQYQAALTSIQNYTTQLQEQQKQIEFLKDKLLEVEKPYKNMPKFIVHIVNWFLNLFNKNK